MSSRSKLAVVLAVLTLAILVYEALPRERVLYEEGGFRIVEVNGRRKLLFTGVSYIAKHPPEDPFGDRAHEATPYKHSTFDFRVLSCESSNADCILMSFEDHRDSVDVRRFVVIRTTFRARVPRPTVNVRHPLGGAAFTTGEINVTPDRVYTWVINISSVNVSTSVASLRLHPFAIRGDGNVLLYSHVDVVCRYVDPNTGAATERSVPTTYNRLRHNSTHVEWWAVFEYTSEFRNRAPVTCWLGTPSGYGFGRIFFLEIRQPIDVLNIEIRVYYVAPASTPVS